MLVHLPEHDRLCDGGNTTADGDNCCDYGSDNDGNAEGRRDDGDLIF